ncbi:2-methylcitrate dehydratase [Agaricicola taiwanensis]|uniref:2-methylcitrate dehydratase n=1 Tax=Agaricicola taiwanensis TaxID=591372 RepID=A0A8J2VJI5_9RHOB|nr:MmgE/PrpD family protein [Agaricicola taiwanensis]GGE32125.1 2-methylcitrate dehydratase [Agaricicola taiwanensis]
MPHDTVSVPLAGSIARAVTGISYDAMPAEVAERACLLILDAVGVALAASARGHGRGLIESLAALGGTGSHAVIGHPAQLGARDAACANGLLMHSLEFDDTHMAAILHVTCTAFPAVLATGAHLGASGREVLEAYVAGAEVAARLGMAAKGAFQRRGFHPTGVIGTFAAALATGKLLKLDHEQMVHAQGIALSLASGSMQFLDDGGSMKSFHPGWAAQAGMTAAMMAAQGLTGARHTYEGRFGLFQSFIGMDALDTDLPGMVQSIGAEWEVPKIAVKPFPAAYYSHACIEAAVELSQYDNFDIDEVEEITACVPAEVVGKIGAPIERKRRPKTPSDAQFALPFLVATALVRRQFTLSDIDADVLQDARILALADRVLCEGVSGTSFPTFYPGSLVVRLRDGQTFTKSVDINLGSQGRPIGSNFIQAKFISNTDRSFAAGEAADGIMSFILNLPDRPNIRDFYQAVAAPAGAATRSAKDVA